ncbi:MAG: cupin domain-containing protein [Proteobacteria bacterium]|nr:cupin domain-containing protein [Pseudomonadota bacterium]
MPVTVEKNSFTGMDGMFDVLKSRKLWPLTAKHFEIPKEEPHWHAYNNTILVVEGTPTVFCPESGNVYQAGPGDVVSIQAGTLHGVEATEPVVVIVAFDEPVRMADMAANPPETLDA